jgi:SHS2 domain-containing protein
MWEHFPHDADMGVRGLGETKESAFEDAALALVALTTDTTDVEARERIAVSCRAPDDEQLLVEWLDAIVFEMATKHMVFSKFEVRIDGSSLSGAALGERRDEARHAAGVEVKGATFTELHVGKREDGLWVAQCVVDV